MKQLRKETATEQEDTQEQPLPFVVGHLRFTPGIIEMVPLIELLDGLDRHRRQDWGEVPAEDWEANNHAVLHGGRILSAYDTKEGTRFWIITEANRQVSTALLPLEY